MNLKIVVLIAVILSGLCLASPAALAEQRMKALLISGQMNPHHNAELMDQVLREYLLETGLFDVERVQTPAAGKDMSTFRPEFSGVDVVVLNYDGDAWPEATRMAFEEWMHSGGGLVTVHSTDNAFPDWQAFLEMTALGGWGGRDERWGPAVYWRDGEVVRDSSPGSTFHPPQHEYPVTFRDLDHPITRDLPESWMHGHDELYSRLRGPARNMTLLGTGFANPEIERASGEHEAAIFTIQYGQGRVFHTTLGHINRDATEPPDSVRCQGFITTFKRGAEWAASGQVSQPAPAKFPAPGEVLIRP